MKISVVIPVYNVENYLDRCLESIVNQEYQNLEIILINDGSIDQSPQICDKWANKDSRIVVIHKKNEGLGFTRNRGINRATGQYITFVDSDDWLELDTYKKCMDVFLEFNPEVISFGYKRVDEYGILSTKLAVFREGYYDKKSIMEEILPNSIASKTPFDFKNEISMSAWAHIYDIKLIRKNNLLFKHEKEIVSEDYCFNMEVFVKMNSYYLMHECFYNYYVRLDSITNTYDLVKYYKYENLYQAYKNILKDHDLHEENKNRLDCFWVNSMYAILSRPCRKGLNIDYKTVKHDMKIIFNDNRLQDALLRINRIGCNMKQHGLLFLFKIKSPFLFYYSYRMIIRK